MDPAKMAELGITCGVVGVARVDVTAQCEVLHCIEVAASVAPQVECIDGWDFGSAIKIVGAFES